MALVFSVLKNNEEKYKKNLDFSQIYWRDMITMLINVDIYQA